jgi:predicted MFS family arabinose efflux permease
MALLMLPMIVITWRAPEPEAVRPPRTLTDAFTKPFLDFFARKGALIGIAFIMLYKLGDYVASGMIQPFLIKTGFSGTEIAAWYKLVGFTAMTVGVLLGGGLVTKLGVRKALCSSAFSPRSPTAATSPCPSLERTTPCWPGPSASTTCAAAWPRPPSWPSDVPV